VVAFAMSPDGKRFVTAGQDNVVKLWNTADGRELRKWDFRLPVLPSKPFVRNLAFSPQGKHVATANANATLYLLELP
jgi:WD40 repeat protein